MNPAARLLLNAVLAIAIVPTPLQPGDAGVSPDDVAAIVRRIEAPQEPDRQGFDALTLREVMARLRVPGVSLAVVKDFEVHWTKTYGIADVDTGRPVEDTTLFQAASISKPLTAMAAMRLVQDGKLELDADVNAVLRSWKVPNSPSAAGGPVTPRSLFSHTSGADDGFGFPGYDPGTPMPTAVDVLNGDAPSNVGQVLFVRPPFQSYKYSGGGTTIMQVALTDLTGTPFAELMESLVLRPLGMPESTYEQPLPASREARAARGHDGRGRSMGARWHVYPEQAAAGLWTTPRDLARVVIEVQRAATGRGGAVLAPASAREMVTPVGVGPFAVGLSIDRRGEGWYFSHGGSNWGFRANLVGHLRKGYGLVIMTNGDSGGPLINEIEARVAAAYNWDSLHKPLVR